MRNSMAMTMRRAGVLAGAAGVMLQAGLLPAQEPLYEKQPTLQQTMLATRARLQQWQAAQKDARGAIKVGTWQRVKLGGKETFDPAADEHNDFYAKNEVGWDEEDYADAAAELRVKRLENTIAEDRRKVEEQQQFGQRAAHSRRWLAGRNQESVFAVFHAVAVTIPITDDAWQTCRHRFDWCQAKTFLHIINKGKENIARRP